MEPYKFEMQIKTLAREYKERRNKFMQVLPKTKKKIRAFEGWLCDVHLVKDDIIDTEQKYFDFCSHCKETSYFHCNDFNLAWVFEIPCNCERSKTKKRIQKNKAKQKRSYQVKKKCKDCFKELSANNKSGFCRECFLKRKKPKLEEADKVKQLIDLINNYGVDNKRKR